MISVLISFFLAGVPLEETSLLQPTPWQMHEQVCRQMPIGLGIPGFQPGIHKSYVLHMFGVPTGTEEGYWPHTDAVFYELIRDRVSLGFLFDRNSGVLRQTEASFATEFDFQEVLKTLDAMSGCQIDREIKLGLQQVWTRQSPRYSFTLGPLEGIIEWETQRDRIYIGIWQSDLH
ncbi:MAG: hypothetical protein AB4352_05360 [Hormoscilla sp.]